MPSDRPLADRNFDDLSDRFRNNIYNSPKGALRLSLCWREMLAQLPELEGGQVLKIWDAGGGLGQMSHRLCRLGHELHYSDISGEMLQACQTEAQASDLSGISYYQQSIQSMAEQAQHQHGYDLIVCHAVLEWVSDGDALLASLAQCLRPGGHLSLMFYNLNALVLSNMSKGNLYKLRDRDFAGHPGGLTPPSPQSPHHVAERLEVLGLGLKARRGIRLVYDLMPRVVRDARSLDDVEAIEWQYGGQEPFWALGRYVHMLCQRPE